VQAETRSAFIAIVGRPNVGKSSLLNRLLGEKLAIVTQKPQTTRSKITGVLTKDAVQFVFIDTPGLHRPHTKLSEYMVKQVNESVADVDAAVLVVEPQGEVGEAERNLIESFRSLGLPAVLAVNKIDLLKEKEALLARIGQFAPLFDFDAVIPLSAVTGEGVEALLGQLDTYAAPGPHYFDNDALTDQPERVIAAEIVREKILLNMSEEIPHGTAVEVESMKERPEQNIIDISCVIYCEKASHKGMIIGKGGRMLKKIATAARLDLERFLDVKVNLQCWVKVQDDWRNKEQFMKSLGMV
jgi:GTP-binding protein Era